MTRRIAAATGRIDKIDMWMTKTRVCAGCGGTDWKQSYYNVDLPKNIHVSSHAGVFSWASTTFTNFPSSSIVWRAAIVETLVS